MSKKVVAFIPIKLNSERLPGKNIKKLGSMPLIQHILNTLIKSKNINDIYVFCSDESIIDLLPNQVKFLKRDKSLDRDETLGSEIYDSFINLVDSDYYLLAHATSPFIKLETVSNSIEKVLSDKFDSAFTAKEIKNFIWFNDKPLNYSLDLVPRTQDIEPIYVECSAFFIFSKKMWQEEGRRIGNNPYMALLQGEEAVDIDEKDDFELAEFYLKQY